MTTNAIAMSVACAVWNGLFSNRNPDRISTMAHFNLRIFVRSFRYAFKGLAFALRYEQSFRVQATIAVLVILLMALFRVSIQEALILVLVISSVLVLELLNTVLEKFIDVLKPRIHYFVEVIKDLMAAAVFVASLGAIIVGLLIFLPHLR